MRERWQAWRNWWGCAIKGHDPEPKIALVVRQCARCGEVAPDYMQHEDTLAAIRAVETFQQFADQVAESWREFARALSATADELAVSLERSGLFEELSSASMGDSRL